MALTSIPPWLAISPDLFLNAASTGARLGLERAGMATSANEAADRLRLGYSQLGAENARQGAALGAENQRFAAANALRQSEFNTGLQQWIAEQAVRENREKLAEKAASDKEKQAAAEKLLHVGKGLYGWSPGTGAFTTKVAPPKEMDALTKLKYQSALKRANGARAGLNRPDVQDDANAKAALQSELQDAMKEIQAIESSMGGAPASQGASTAGAPAGSSAFSTSPDWFNALPVGSVPTNAADALAPDEQAPIGDTSFSVGKYKVTPLK